VGTLDEPGPLALNSSNAVVAIDYHLQYQLVPMKMTRSTTCLVLGIFTACSTQHMSQAPLPISHAEVGVLVMAHGGGPDWNAQIENAARGLRRRMPTAVAFGMADATTLTAGLDSLSRQGVRRVAVVRLFVSGDSFLERTAALLGLEFPTKADGSEHRDGSVPIAHSLEIATHRDGLADWSGIGPLIAQRALQASDDPGEQSVLIVAHGAGDEAENAGLLARMNYAAEAIRAAGFLETRVATLREDWPEARAAAAKGIREFVQDQNDSGHSVIVVPFRVSGFGPYAEVLAGLTYTRGESLLPHPAISDWMEQTAMGIICGNGWRSEVTDCPEAYLATTARS